MYNILESKKQDVTPGLAVNIVQLGLAEMTRDKVSHFPLTLFYFPLGSCS